MFKLNHEQRVCKIGDILIGGQPGQNPPLCISSMFHKGDKLLDSRKDHKFDRVKAREYVLRQEELSQQTGVPALVALVATSPDEMKAYVDFMLETTDKPFGIDMWVEKARLEAAEYIAQLGIQDRVLYNSITPWDADIPAQVAKLKELNIKHVVIQVYDEEDLTPTGRLKSMKKMLELIGEDTFESLMVDTAVMNLPSMSFSCIANRMIKDELGYPCGVASSNGTYMWKEAREMWGSDGFTAVNGAGQAMAALLWSDLLFTGPIVNLPKIMPAVATASTMLSTLAFYETNKMTENPNHPIFKLFEDFAKKL